MIRDSGHYSWWNLGFRLFGCFRVCSWGRILYDRIHNFCSCWPNRCRFAYHPYSCKKVKWRPLFYEIIKTQKMSTKPNWSIQEKQCLDKVKHVFTFNKQMSRLKYSPYFVSLFEMIFILFFVSIIFIMQAPITESGCPLYMIGTTCSTGNLNQVFIWLPFQQYT